MYQIENIFFAPFGTNFFLYPLTLQEKSFFASHFFLSLSPFRTKFLNHDGFTEAKKFSSWLELYYWLKTLEHSINVILQFSQIIFFPAVFDDKCKTELLIENTVCSLGKKKLNKK